MSIKEIIAQILVVAGKALLCILPEVPPCEASEEPTELDLFTMCAIEVMATDKYQALPEAKQLQFQSAMTSALGVFFEEDAGQKDEQELVEA
jgi:hypothetical protein